MTGSAQASVADRRRIGLADGTPSLRTAARPKCQGATGRIESAAEGQKSFLHLTALERKIARPAVRPSGPQVARRRRALMGSLRSSRITRPDRRQGQCRRRHDRSANRAERRTAFAPNFGRRYGRQDRSGSPASRRKRLTLISTRWRHTPASQLIDAGIDVVRISKRLGHASPAITLRIYAHLFSKHDSESADAIDSALAAFGKP